MRILQIANDYLGSGIYKLLFKALEQQGEDQTVVVPMPYGTQAGELPAQVYVVPCFNNLDRLLFFTKQNKMLHWMERNLELRSFDVIHAHTVFSGGYTAWQLHKRYGTPYVIAVRDTDVNVFFKRMVHLRKIGVRIMRDAAQIIFLSPVYKKNVLKNYIPSEYRQEILNKSRVIPNGIAQLFFDCKAKPRKQYGEPLQLIHVGLINSRKNLELTIQAAEVLRSSGQEVVLTAVGSLVEKKYRDLIAEKNFVIHYDRCSQEEIIAFMREADILVVPSHTETFGLVYAEAMSQGLPVLYTKGQGFDGQFPEGTVGYAVSDTDAQDVADKIRLIMDRYETISANTVTMVEKFRWDTIAEEYAKIYASIKVE